MAAQDRTLRTTRFMTSVYLVRDENVLLLYRVGSRAIDDSWVGIGGHVEPAEIGDPTAAALRELEEEVGVDEGHIADLALRYVSIRDRGDELRLTYYFTAALRPGVPGPTECTEGELCWFPLTAASAELAMPPTASVVMRHWITVGRHDALLRAVVLGVDGEHVVSLAGR